MGSFLVQGVQQGAILLQGSIPCSSAWRIGPFALPAGPYLARLNVRDARTSLPQSSTAGIEVPVSAVDGEVLVDLHTARLRGSLALDGAAPVENNCAAGQQVGVLQFRDSGSQTLEIPVACGGSFTFDARLFNGTYRVSFRGFGRSNLPYEHLIDPAMVVDGPRDGIVFDLADRTSLVSGSLSIGGAPPSVAPGCFSESTRLIFQRDGAESAIAIVPCRAPFNYSVRLLPGTYRVTVRGGISGVTQPFEYKGLPDVVVGAAALVRDVDVPLVPVTGRVTVGGQTPTEDPACTGAVATLSVGASVFPIACQSGFTFGPGQFVPGVASGYFSATSSTRVPSGPIAFVVPEAGGPVVADLTPTHTLRVKVTVNGAPLDSTGCIDPVGGIDIRSPGLYTGFGLSCTGEASLSVFAGTYRLSTQPGRDGRLPAYTHPTLVEIYSDTFVELDITTHMVSGQLRLDGVVPSETAACVAGQNVAEVHFLERRSGSTSPTVAVIPCGGDFRYGPIALGTGVYSVSVAPVGTPARSTLPPYRYGVIERFEVE